jgi:hypothetical protein
MHSAFVPSYFVASHFVRELQDVQKSRDDTSEVTGNIHMTQEDLRNEYIVRY